MTACKNNNNNKNNNNQFLPIPLFFQVLDLEWKEINDDLNSAFSLFYKRGHRNVYIWITDCSPKLTMCNIYTLKCL